MTWLTKKQVADRLGCCTKTVERLMRTGDLPYYRPSPHIIRFDARDIEAHLERSRIRIEKKPEPAYRRFHYVPGQKVV